MLLIKCSNPLTHFSYVGVGHTFLMLVSDTFFDAKLKKNFFFFFHFKNTLSLGYILQTTTTMFCNKSNEEKQCEKCGVKSMCLLDCDECGRMESMIEIKDDYSDEE